MGGPAGHYWALPEWVAASRGLGGPSKVTVAGAGAALRAGGNTSAFHGRLHMLQPASAPLESASVKICPGLLFPALVFDSAKSLGLPEACFDACGATCLPATRWAGGTQVPSIRELVHDPINTRSDGNYPPARRSPPSGPCRVAARSVGFLVVQIGERAWGRGTR